MIMASPAMNQEVNDLVRSSEGARNAIQREDWGIAQQPSDAVLRLGEHPLREVDEKSRDVMMAPKPEHGDRG